MHNCACSSVVLFQYYLTNGFSFTLSSFCHMLYYDLPGKHTWQCVSVKVVLISSILCTPSPQRSLTVTSLTFCFQSTNTSEKHKGTDSHIDVKPEKKLEKKMHFPSPP